MLLRDSSSGASSAANPAFTKFISCLHSSQNLCYDRGLRCTEGMFLGAAGLVEEVLEFVDFGVKTVVQSKASLIAVAVLKRAVAAKRKDQKV